MTSNKSEREGVDSLPPPTPPHHRSASDSVAVAVDAGDEALLAEVTEMVTGLSAGPGASAVRPACPSMELPREFHSLN